MKQGLPYASLKPTPVDDEAVRRAYERTVECWLRHPLDCRCSRS